MYDGICSAYAKYNAEKEKLNTAIDVAESAQHTVISMQDQMRSWLSSMLSSKRSMRMHRLKSLSLSVILLIILKRLYVNATCSKPVPTKSSTASVDDERAPELNRDAERSYLRLRQQITTITAQVNGLRSYIEALPSECVAK